MDGWMDGCNLRGKNDLSRPSPGRVLLPLSQGTDWDVADSVLIFLDSTAGADRAGTRPTGGRAILGLPLPCLLANLLSSVNVQPSFRGPGRT